MYGVWLIIIIAVMGGAIAYIGDKLGTKVGKKKLMILGLRPKHTSIVVTIITGILIAATTLGFLASSSQNVRTALFGMEALKVQLSELDKEVLAQNLELEASRKTLEEKNIEYSKLSIKIAETSSKLANITAELAQVTAERNETATALKTTQQDYNEKLVELSVTKIDLINAQKDIDSLQVIKKDLDVKVADLNKEKVALNNYTHEQPVITRSNEPLATIVIKGGRSRENIERELNGFLFKANQSIAKKKLNLENHAVLKIDPIIFSQTVTMLASNNEEFIVDIHAVHNTFLGEIITVHFKTTPNKLIYLKDTTIQSAIIELGSGKSSLELQVILQEFIKNKLHADAQKQGIRINPSLNSVGKISSEYFFHIVNRMQKMRGRVEICATAKQNIYTVDLLEVNLRVHSLD